MEIEINKLKEYEFNKELFDSLNKEDYSALLEDIKKNGIKTELHITKSNTVLCGHQRLKIANEIGLKRVPVKIVNINENDELKVKEYVILDNVLRRHLSTEQKWKLYSELSKVYEVGRGGDRKSDDFKDVKSKSLKVEDVIKKTAEAVGVSESTIDKARAYDRIIKERKELSSKKATEVLAIISKEKKIEKLKEEVKEVESEELNLFEGDCLTELGNIDYNSVACLIIDPPYGIDYQSNYKLAKHDKIDSDTSDAFKLLDKSLKVVKPKMKKDSHVYIFTTWKVYEKVKPIVEKYFEVKNCLIWNKNNWSMGDLNGNYAEKYEMIIFATQGNRRLLGEKRPVNVLDFERTNNSNHPTEKPVELLKELIKNSTVEGEVVLDYFAGSGSTMVAAKELNRVPYGIEKDKNYIDVIKGRLK